MSLFGSFHLRLECLLDSNEVSAVAATNVMVASSMKIKATALLLHIFEDQGTTVTTVELNVR